MTRTQDITRSAAPVAAWAVRATGLALSAIVTLSVLSSLGGVADKQYLSAQADHVAATTAYAAASAPAAAETAAERATQI